jgi:hypothetical protein
MHTGQSISLDGENEVHAVASLLKLYLRELPEPLLTYHEFDDLYNATTGVFSALCLLVCISHLCHCITAYQADTTTGLAQIRSVLSHLPAENIALQRFLWYASKAVLDSIYLVLLTKLIAPLLHSTFLHVVTSHSADNMMPINNIATVFGPNFVSAKQVCRVFVPVYFFLLSLVFTGS